MKGLPVVWPSLSSFLVICLGLIGSSEAYGEFCFEGGYLEARCSRRTQECNKFSFNPPCQSGKCTCKHGFASDHHHMCQPVGELKRGEKCHPADHSKVCEVGSMCVRVFENKTYLPEGLDEETRRAATYSQEYECGCPSVYTKINDDCYALTIGQFCEESNSCNATQGLSCGRPPPMIHGFQIDSSEEEDEGGDKKSTKSRDVTSALLESTRPAPTYTSASAKPRGANRRRFSSYDVRDNDQICQCKHAMRWDHAQDRCVYIEYGAICKTLLDCSAGILYEDSFLGMPKGLGHQGFECKNQRCVCTEGYSPQVMRYHWWDFDDFHAEKAVKVKMCFPTGKVMLLRRGAECRKDSWLHGYEYSEKGFIKLCDPRYVCFVCPEDKLSNTGYCREYVISGAHNRFSTLTFSSSHLLIAPIIVLVLS